MNTPIRILFGTQTGNSETVAHLLADALEAAGHEVDLLDLADAYPELLEDTDRLIVAVCTWAEGTFPDNAVAFWDALQEVSPDCSRLRYGLVALGDRLYDPYYQTAAYRLADRLDALGATRATGHFEIDGALLPSHRNAVRDWAFAWIDAA